LILLQEQAIKEAAAAAERRKLEEELKNCSPESLEARNLAASVAAAVTKSRKVTLESIFWCVSLCVK
jgi:transcription factor IIIB subunit 2